MDTFSVIITIIGTIATVLATYLAWVSKKDNSNVKKLNQKSSVKNHLERIKTDKKIKVGYFDYPPLVSVANRDSSPSGVYVKIVEEIAQKNQLEIDWKLINLSGSVNSIITNEIDVYISIFQTPKRNRDAKFIAFLHSIEVSGIVKKGFPRINTLKALNTKKIKYVVCKDEIGDEILDDILKVPKSQKSIIDTNNISSIASFVQYGYADIALADSLSCFEFMKRNTDIGMRLINFKPPIAVYNNGFMVSKDNGEFTDWLEKEIESIVTKAEFINYEKEIIDEYKKVINKIR